MADCLIIARSSEAYAAEVATLSGGVISCTACEDPGDAKRRANGEKVLFGDPDLVADCLEGMPDVRWVQSTWAGVTPLLELARRDYLLTGVKEVLGPQIAEYVIGFMLEHELQIPRRRVAQQQRRWDSAETGTLFGKHLGILGAGSIGRQVARVAKAFSMQVTGINRRGQGCSAYDSVVSFEDVAAVFPQFDYLVSILPDTPATTGLLNAERLAWLPEHAVLINVGRGNAVDDNALLAALESQQLAAAILDVFDEEPLPSRSPLWRATNLTVTAHVAATSHPALIAPIFVENWQRFKQGRRLSCLVDFAAGY